VVGPDALPDGQRVLLATARRLREDYLQQPANQGEDAFCPLDKAQAMLRVHLAFHDALLSAVGRGADPEELLRRPEAAAIARLRDAPPDEAVAAADRLLEALPDLAARA
jgi:V/A-type H+-transporting ATPase subunit A